MNCLTVAIAMGASGERFLTDISNYPRNVLHGRQFGRPGELIKDNLWKQVDVSRATTGFQPVALSAAVCRPSRNSPEVRRHVIPHGPAAVARVAGLARRNVRLSTPWSSTGFKGREPAVEAACRRAHQRRRCSAGYYSGSCVGVEGISLAPVMKATASDIVTCSGSTTPMRRPRRWICMRSATSNMAGMS
jgi:hypothetical protein